MSSKDRGNDATEIVLDPCALIIKLLTQAPDEPISPEEWDLVDGYLCKKTLVERGKKLKLAIQKLSEKDTGELLDKLIQRIRDARDRRHKINRKSKS